MTPPTMRSRLTRRTLLAGATAVAGAAALLRHAAALAQTNPDGRTRLLLLGTQGGPQVNVRRSQTASVVVAGGEPYLVDCGYGTVRALVAAGVGYLRVGNVFLTHLHDDHAVDVAALLSMQWTASRSAPTTVHGPHGTAALVAGALAFTRANADIRTADEGRPTRPEELFRGRDIEAPARPMECYRDPHVAVSAVENTHFPDEAKARMLHRALSYRFDGPDRSIVFSGDTTYSENLVALARDADVFVCEAMETQAQRRAFERAVEAGSYRDNPSAIWRHIAETHATTEQVGRMAAEANVKTVVLYHLLPGANDDLPDETYIAGVRRAFRGEEIVGRDLLEI